MQICKKIGLIGFRMMGDGMGKNLLEKGVPLTVMAHQDRSQMEDLIAGGNQEVSNFKDITLILDTDFVCVIGSSDVEQIFYGQNDILDGCHKRFIIPDYITREPSLIESINADLVSRNVVMADQPLVSTRNKAEAGRLNIMVGALEETLLYGRASI